MTAGGRLGKAAARRGFLVGGEKTKCPLFFGCTAQHAVNMVNCKTVVGCSLQLEQQNIAKEEAEQFFRNIEETLPSLRVLLKLKASKK